MRDKSQMFLPLNLEICIDKENFVFTLAEICESLNYDKLFETYIMRYKHAITAIMAVKVVRTQENVIGCKEAFVKSRFLPIL